MLLLPNISKRKWRFNRGLDFQIPSWHVHRAWKRMDVTKTPMQHRAWAFSLACRVGGTRQGFGSRACGGELCRERPWAAPCQSLLSPATPGTGDSNTRCARRAARQVSRRYPSTPAPTYLWKTCSHQGEEDARGDRLLEASGWGDSWRCAAEGAAVEPQPEALFDRRCPCQRELFIGDGSPQASRAKEGRPLRDYSPWAPHTGEGHIGATEGNPRQTETLRTKQRQRESSKKSDRTHYVLDSNHLRCPSPHQDREGLSITGSENKGKSV